MRTNIIIFIGAGLGGIARHCVNSAAAFLFGISFPYGTLAVNVLGSFAIGLLVDYFALRGEASQYMRLFLTTGFLGGFTTFSAFSLDIALMYERGQVVWALSYAILAVALSVSALFGGMWLMRHLLPWAS